MMTVGIDWITRVITIPQADLSLVSGTLYDMDTEGYLRTELHTLQASEDGQVFDAIFRHNTQVTVAGTTYARTIEIINGYSIAFEDGQYSVRLSGSNNNVFDVENGILAQNQVQVISNNAAGLIVTTAAAAQSDCLTVGKFLALK